MEKSDLVPGSTTLQLFDEIYGGDITNLFEGCDQIEKQIIDSEKQLDNLRNAGRKRPHAAGHSEQIQILEDRIRVYRELLVRLEIDEK